MSAMVPPAAAPGGGWGSAGSGRAARLSGAAWLLGGFCVTLPFTIQLFSSGDEWWHLALGRLILSHGIPTTEPFSFVATQHPWVEQQWLYEVILASLVRLGGDGLASLAWAWSAASPCSSPPWPCPARRGSRGAGGRPPCSSAA